MAAQLRRCQWPGIEDPLYTRYHDEEWGVPRSDEGYLFEKLVLEGFQAGLSWITILRKREAFRAAFRGFDPDVVARFGPRDFERLMADASIVRNRLKIEGAILSAQAYLELRETGTLSQLLWGFVDGKPIQSCVKAHGDLAAETPLSREISKALKARGFRFVGPTTIYAYMQSIGLVNDHLVSCHRHGVCAKLGAEFRAP